MDIWVSSSFWLLRMKLLWTFVYKSLYRHMLFFFPYWVKIKEWSWWMIWCLYVKETAKLSSSEEVPFYSSTSNVGEFIFAHSLQHLVVSVFLNFSYSNRYVVVSYRGLNLHFPDDVEHLFMCYLVMCLFQSFAHFYWPVLYLWSFDNSLCILDSSALSPINPLSDFICKRHFCNKWLALRSVFWRTENCKFYEIHWLCFW